MKSNHNKYKRCNKCKKKIKSLFSFPCKCEKYFCFKHTHDHKCTYDHAKEYKILLLNQNEKVEHKKMEYM